MLNARHQRGLTLIELVITLAVMAIVSMAIAPSVTTAIANARLRSATESMQAGIQSARAEAMRLNQTITFTLVTATSSGTLDATCEASDSGRGWVVSREAPASKCDVAVGTTTSPQIVDKRAPGPVATQFTVAGRASDGATAANTLTFDSLGAISAGSLRRITVSPADGTSGDLRALRIEMTSGGVMRVCEPAVTSTSDPRRCLV